jgi:DNA-binding winged helix-turn-helix (wHTH) protein
MEKPGEIVSQEELRARLWPDDTNVEFNHSIHGAINKLRQALGDSHERHSSSRPCLVAVTG